MKLIFLIWAWSAIWFCYGDGWFDKGIKSKSYHLITYFTKLIFVSSVICLAAMPWIGYFKCLI